MDVPAKGNVLGRVVPARYVLAVLGSIGMAIVYGLKVNLSVALVGMLNKTAIKIALGNKSHDETLFKNLSVIPDDEECQPTGGSNRNATELVGPFVWSSEVQGIVLSCYFWGYFVSQIPGARVAELFSAKWVMFFSVAINVVCTLLTPVMAEAHYIAVVIMRVGEGIGGGVTFPAMHVLLSKWAPPAERSVMAALVYAGTSLGTVISMLMAGVLTANVGWESVFYVMGGLSCVWCVLWVILVQDSPQQQPLISAEERSMIVSSLGGKTNDKSHKKLPVPWSKVLKSPPFLAILVSHACSNWGWYMLLIETPFYMDQVLKFDMTENAVITALPFLSLWIFSIALSRTLDWLRSKNIITTTTARKIGTLFASLVPAACLLGLCYIGCNRAGAVVLMAVGITSIGGMFCGFLSNHIDIAPNFAGTLMAMTNTVATIPGIVVPIFVGILTHGNQTISAWRVIFFVTIGLYIIEIIAYTLFGSGEEQSWNKVTENKEDFEVKPLKNEKTHV
ncbi:ec74 protein isoform X1 [Bombyx mori]|uniref:Major facilitator superfamily (MFS) profile domain-containing protein n=1 Tax=Bombyx mori TaxID=7091 RepID=A0A8R2AKM1_BOMMO|nr:ec74 protein isoform X2 [Bombyx mori]